jgi:hypothetical protein
MARTYSREMISVLVGIARSPKAPEGARVVAANSVLDRGWGKAEQQHAGPDGGALRVIIRQLTVNVEENTPLVIDNEVVRIEE